MAIANLVYDVKLASLGPIANLNPAPAPSQMPGTDATESACARPRSAVPVQPSSSSSSAASSAAVVHPAAIGLTFADHRLSPDARAGRWQIRTQVQRFPAAPPAPEGPQSAESDGLRSFSSNPTIGPEDARALNEFAKRERQALQTGVPKESAAPRKGPKEPDSPSEAAKPPGRHWPPAPKCASGDVVSWLKREVLSQLCPFLEIAQQAALELLPGTNIEELTSHAQCVFQDQGALMESVVCPMHCALCPGSRQREYVSARGKVFPRFGVAPRVGVKDSHSSVWPLEWSVTHKRGIL